jgi:hypothetical protein
MWKAWILSALAAGVASLVATTPAVAADRDGSATTRKSATDDAVVSLLGFDICFGDAPNKASCDVMLPLPQPPAKRINLLGTTLCIGGGPQTPGCDVRLPAVANKE